MRSLPRLPFVTLPLIALIFLFLGCGKQPPPQQGEPVADVPGVEPVMERAMSRIRVYADSMDAVLRPVSLLNFREKAGLRQYPNRVQLERARRLGVGRPATDEDLDALLEDSSLVPIEDTTRYWVVRELDYSAPYLTPDARALLVQIGERFQERLEEMGLPALRFEISSMLRTPANQRALRRTNPNAARTVSTHEFGTTADIAYSSYAAPAEPVLTFETGEFEWLRPYLAEICEVAVARVAAKRSRELQAIMGDVLRELQAEGKVMVTLEERQPVYHFTVARSMD